MQMGLAEQQDFPFGLFIYIYLLVEFVLSRYFAWAPVGLRRRPVPFGAHSAFRNSGDQIWRFSHRACFSYHFYVCGSGDSLPSTLSFFLLSEGTKQTINQASS